MDSFARILVTIFCLGLVVVVHELGHLIVARWLGVRVERFTVGFGPELFGFTARAIRYSICAIPLGGMVKMAGDAVDSRSNNPEEFFGQPWYRRNLIALAGPAMNYVLAFVLFATVAGVWGILQPSKEAIVGDLIPGMPAAAAKLQPGDRIVKIDGQAIASWEEMAKQIHGQPDKKLQLEIARTAEDGKVQTLNLPLTPARDPQRGIGLIGVVPKVDKVRPGFKGSLEAGYRDIKAWTVQPMKYLSQKARSMEGPKELSGPIGIAHMVTKATKEGFAYVVYLIAIISTGLGLFNLFPIPILDGGHVLLYTIEGIRRKPLSQKALNVANAVGLAFVLLVFLYASYQDVLRLRLGLFK